MDIAKGAGGSTPPGKDIPADRRSRMDAAKNESRRRLHLGGS